MSIDELQGQYQRLQGELAAAYEAPSWDGGEVDRLADEIATLERRLAVHVPLGLPEHSARPAA